MRCLLYAPTAVSRTATSLTAVTTLHGRQATSILSCVMVCGPQRISSRLRSGRIAGRSSEACRCAALSRNGCAADPSERPPVSGSPRPPAGKLPQAERLPHGCPQLLPNCHWAVWPSGHRPRLLCPSGVAATRQRVSQSQSVNPHWVADTGSKKAQNWQASNFPVGWLDLAGLVTSWSFPACRRPAMRRSNDWGSIATVQTDSPCPSWIKGGCPSARTRRAGPRTRRTAWTVTGRPVGPCHATSASP